MINEWRDVIGYEGLYQVNVKGDIYSLFSQKILKPFYRGSRADNKYLVVDLHKDGERKVFPIHRLVALAFLPNPLNLPCINHIDGNKNNNCLENLEWCSYSENNIHAIKNGLKKYPKGINNKCSKLSNTQIIEIKQTLILNSKEFNSRALGEKYGVDHNVILDIYHNKKYQDVIVPYTYFVCSDIHSAYSCWMEALSKAGFNPNKYTHKIIVCGDLFDRMDESQQVCDFVNSMIKQNKIILIKGNHEYLFEELCDRGYPMSHDWHNGTAKTIMDLAPTSKNWDGAIPIAKEKVKPYFDSLVNYFETEHYIFVHSWVPVLSKSDYRKSRYDKEYNPNWREAHTSEWNDATWGNPFDLAQDGLNQTGKIIVHGHYHNSLGWVYKTHGALSEFGEDANFDICEHENCIGLDACTAYSGKVNVLVIEDELLEEN